MAKKDQSLNEHSILEQTTNLTTVTTTKDPGYLAFIDFLNSGQRANNMNAIVIRLKVCTGLVLKRDARQTQANRAALNENVLDTLY